MNKQRSSAAKVAVITRTQDRPMLLQRALESAQSQTMSDFVQVVVNDGGDKHEVEKLTSQYPEDKIHVIHNDTVIGFTAALNQGIQAVQSEYVTILDDDDTWPEERLEKTISYLDRTQEKVVVVKMDVVIEDIVDGKIQKISQYLHPESGEGEISLFKQFYRNYISNGIVTYRREVYDEIGGYDESLEVGEDWDFGIKLMLRYDVAFLRDEPPLFFYHQRPKQTGAEGNSVHARVLQQEKTINTIRNRYLRQDINSGKMGVGYIMNRLAHDDTLVVRLEGHMNHVAGEIKDSNHQLFGEMISKIDGIQTSKLSHRIVRKLKRKL